MRRDLLSGAAIAGLMLLIAIATPWLIREVRSLPRASALAARGHQRIVTLDVAGMTCAACAAKVQGELALVPGVADADVRIAQRQAIIVCSPAVTDSALIAAVGRAGPAFMAAPANP